MIKCDFGVIFGRSVSHLIPDFGILNIDSYYTTWVRRPISHRLASRSTTNLSGLSEREAKLTPSEPIVRPNRQLKPKAASASHLDSKGDIVDWPYILLTTSSSSIAVDLPFHWNSTVLWLCFCSETKASLVCSEVLDQ